MWNVQGLEVPFCRGRERGSDSRERQLNDWRADGDLMAK
jgi:hypothetical protein